MAGIFVNVNDDIQNLRALKNEIENVKRALKGINVKVDFDIKENLEAQLKSLTVEYDALASKIAETEGRIKATVERINDSTKKIIEAQEKIVGNAQAQPSAQPSVAATTTETASIQAQSRAYDELKADIDAVLGSRSENIRRMVEEQNAIRLINAELKKMEKNSGGGNYSPAQIKRIEQLNNALFTHKAALAEVRQALNNNAKMDNAAADSMARLSQELGRMRMAYRELTDDERKSPFGQELLASIQEVDAKLKEFDASIGNFQRNVGNYGSAFNGLNTSVQQIVRELPSAAMGLNTFFLAISNNLPILVDEINRARKANAELAKTGEKGVPVWRQVASSLFSWQTALIVGISLLTIYGKDIAEWTKSLFKAKEGVMGLKEAQDKINESFSSDSGNVGEQIALVNKLSIEWKSLGSSLSAQEKFIKENKGEFDKLGVSIANVSDAENLFVNNTQLFIDALIRRARASAGVKLAAEAYKEAIKKQIEADKMADTVKVQETETRYTAEGAIQVATGRTLEVENRAKTLALEMVAAKNKEAEAYLKVAIAQEEQAKKSLENAGIQETGLETTNTEIERVKDMASAIEAMKKKNAQDEIVLEQDLEKKRLKQIELDYNERMKFIEKFEKELTEYRKGNLTEEDKSLISDAKNNARAIREQQLNENNHQKLLEQYRGYFEQRKAIAEKYDKDREGLIAAGASQESLDENQYLKEQALADVDAMFAARDEEFRGWAAKVVDASLEELQNLVQEAEAMIADMKQNDPTNKKIANARAGLNLVKGEIEKKRNKQKVEMPDKNAEKEWQDLYNTLRKVENQFDDIGEAIGGTVGEIISAAGSIASSTLSIVDGIKTLSGAANAGIKGTSEAAVQSISAVEKASVILTIISAALQIATKISEMFGADYSNYNKAKENYETYIDVLDKVIDKQKELSETMTGKDAVEASERAIKLIEKQAKAAKELGKQRLNAGASAGSHSIGVRQRKNMSQEGWNEALNALGKAQYNKINEGRMTGLFDLSVEQLEKLQMEAPTFWAQLDSDVRDYLEQIINSNEGIEQMKELLKETLTGISFEDFSSDVLESLYDVEKGAKDIFDDMSDYMRKALIKSMYVKNYEPEMQKWYDQWSKAMEDGLMSEQERTSLDALKESIINGATSAAEQINSMFDVSEIYKQEATSRGFDTMTQEQAGELNGRFAALQQSGEESNIKLSLMNATMQDLKTVGLDIHDVATSIQDMIANSYIELLTISENTGETVKCLKVIQSDIEKVKENTNKL